MNRRNFLIGLGASTVALSSGIGSAPAAMIAEIPKVPVEQSLIFGKSQGPLGFMLKTKYPEYGEHLYKEANTGGPMVAKTTTTEVVERKPPEMAFSIEKYSSDTTFSFTDANDLDKFYFSKAEMRSIDRLFTGDKIDIFEFERACNAIAKKTRMGKGNNLVLNPIIEEILKTNYPEHYDPKLNRFFNRINVHYRDWVPKNEVMVFYRNLSSGYDVPGLVFDDGGIALNRDFDYAIRLVFKE